MRAVVQRVLKASVTVEGSRVGEIGRGLLVLVGFTEGDAREEMEWMAGKLQGLRVFSDAEGLMNLDITEVGGELLVVSQFTLYGDVSRGRRPSFVAACSAERAAPLIERVAERARELGAPVVCGRFQADMEVTLVNSGPVTILLDTRKQF